MQPASLTSSCRVPGGLMVSVPGDGFAILVPLRAAQDDDVLVAAVLVQRHMGGAVVAQQRGGGPVDAVAVQMMNLHAVAKRLPRNLILNLIDLKKILQLKRAGRESAISVRIPWAERKRNDRVLKGRDSYFDPRDQPKALSRADDSATAPKTPPCILIMLSAAR